MDGFQGYREPPLARSPPERTSWGGRDENYRDRPSDRPESRDNFYRGRSPGVFCHLLYLNIILYTIAMLGSACARLAVPEATFLYFHYHITSLLLC